MNSLHGISLKKVKNFCNWKKNPMISRSMIATFLLSCSVYRECAMYTDISVYTVHTTHSYTDNDCL